MLNLTSRILTLTATDHREPTMVPLGGPRAANCIHEGIVLTGEETDPGSGPIEVARLAAATPAQVENLNRLLEEHIRKDEAATNRKGLVLIERTLLRHVHPRLRDRVAAPVSRDEADNGKPHVTMLVFPPEPYTAPKTPRGHKGYTLFLDRVGVATTKPTTDEIGHAHTWEQLQWLARGAEPFERGGRLWASDDEENSVLHMSDIRLDQPPPPEGRSGVKRTQPASV